MKARLVSTIPDHDLQVINDESDGAPPDSLLEALRLFYVGVAVQAYHRGRNEPTQEHRSMLVHPSMRTKWTTIGSRGGLKGPRSRGWSYLTLLLERPIARNSLRPSAMPTMI